MTDFTPTHRLVIRGVGGSERTILVRREGRALLTEAEHMEGAARGAWTCDDAGRVQQLVDHAHATLRQLPNLDLTEKQAYVLTVLAGDRITCHSGDLRLAKSTMRRRGFVDRRAHPGSPGWIDQLTPLGRAALAHWRSASS